MSTLLQCVEVTRPVVVRGQVYQFLSGEQVCVVSVTPDFDTDEVILVLESYQSGCVSDMTCSDFLNMQPVLVEAR